MATINDKFFADLAGGATWAAGVAFQRSNPLPLDKYSVFASIEDAESYAATNAVAYPGQIVAVVNEGVMEVYVLAEKANEVAEGEEQTYSLALQEMGGKIDLDPNSLGNNSLGLLEMLGFENAANLTLPQKKDGKVQWLPISEIAKGDGNDNTTYTFGLGEDGKSIDITTLENGVAVKDEDGNVIVQNIALNVYTKTEADAAIKVEADRALAAEGVLDGKITELSNTVTGNKTAVDDALALKANSADVYTKDETDSAIESAVKGILGEDVSDAYDTLVEIQKLMEADDTASAELVTKVNANETAIGVLNGGATTEGSVAKTVADAIAAEDLGQYAKSADVEAAYATKTELEDYAKTNDVAGTYATKAELADYAKSDDVSSVYVTKSEAGVDLETDRGIRFINQKEIDKLSKLNLSGDEITISGSVNASQVEGLYAAIEKMVTSTNASEDLDSKVDGIQAAFGIEKGAQVNKIEKVIFNGAEATIEGKTATIAGEYYTKSEADAKVKVASDAASAAQGTANEAKTAAEANAGTISATNELVAEHTGKISGIEKSITQHGADIGTLQETVGTHITDIAQLKTDVQAAAASAGANNTKIGELVAADITINNELTRLESAKANAADVYVKKDVYTKTETDSVIAAITGTPAEGKTLVQMIADAQTAATYDDTTIKASIKANTDALAILNGNDKTEGSIDYKVAQELAKIVNDNNDGNINTLNEIAAWIINDTTGAAKMNADIVANTAAITKLNGTAETEGSVLAMIAAAAPQTATGTILGLVMGSAAENKISVGTDGTMEVNSVNVNKLVQTDGDALVLNGGSANV